MMTPTVVSLFSGAGGLSRGFADADMRPALAVELDGDAVATYRDNVSDQVLHADIGMEAGLIIREAALRSGPSGVFAVIGGPPCQGFSTAGSRDHWDPRNRLVYAYLDIVSGLRPSWFLFENVEGILTSGGGDAVVGLAERFATIGYSFRIEKVNFARWGVPQARKRVLIVGNRHGLDFSLPAATHGFEGKKHRGAGGSATSLGDALAGLPMMPAASHRARVPYATESPASDYDAIMRTVPPGPTGHFTINFSRDEERIRLLRPGQSLRDLPQELWPESYRSRAFRRVADGVPTERRGGAPAGIRRLDRDHASLTITSFSPRELVHPDHDRPLSLRECARLQSFPDGHDFRGGFQSVAQQIGNAFPPMAASVLAKWMRSQDGAVGAGTGIGPPVPPGLIGYHLTEAAGMSPALQATDARLQAMAHRKGRTTMAASRRGRPRQEGLFPGDDPAGRLDADDRKTVEDGRVLGPVTMTDREMGRLISVVLRDLGHNDLIPEWARDIPAADYYDIDLFWFVSDARPFIFDSLFLKCCARVRNFRVIFRCITKLHRHRRKYEVILRNQPLPTMEQIARRGLLEYGTIHVDALASWLTWRKWIYDIDNRSAQETGYLFEPMLTASLGGRSVGAKNSPVKRVGKPDKGRQVDCIVTVGGQRFAYEFKDRVTIAASGQGRFAEELSFPGDCRSSNYIPILLVMDPTPSDKLAAITRAFEAAGGQVYLGDAVWGHLSDLSGQEIADFVKRYIKDPVENIAVRERELLDLGLRYQTGPESDAIEVTIGTHKWIIQRPPRDLAVAPDDDEEDDFE